MSLAVTRTRSAIVDSIRCLVAAGSVGDASATSASQLNRAVTSRRSPYLRATLIQLFPCCASTPKRRRLWANARGPVEILRRAARACLQLGEFCARTDQNQTQNM